MDLIEVEIFFRSRACVFKTRIFAKQKYNEYQCQPFDSYPNCFFPASRFKELFHFCIVMCLYGQNNASQYDVVCFQKEEIVTRLYNYYYHPEM